LYSLLLGYKFQWDCHLLWMTVRTLTKTSVDGIGILTVWDKGRVLAGQSTLEFPKMPTTCQECNILRQGKRIDAWRQ